MKETISSFINGNAKIEKQYNFSFIKSVCGDTLKIKIKSFYTKIFFSNYIDSEKTFQKQKSNSSSFPITVKDFIRIETLSMRINLGRERKEKRRKT